MDGFHRIEHCITLRTPMKILADDKSEVMANILYARSIQGDGQFVNVSLLSVSQTTGAGLSKPQPCTAGVAIPLSNIAGWQTEMK